MAFGCPMTTRKKKKERTNDGERVHARSEDEVTRDELIFIAVVLAVALAAAFGPWEQ